MQYNKRSIYGGSGSILHNLQVVGNNFEGSDGRADSDYVLLLSDCMENDFRFSGNTVEQHGSPAGTVGVSLLNTSTTITPHGIIISDNTFSWIPSHAIDIDHFTSVCIASNTFQACAPSADYSISALNTNGLVISSNVARYADWGKMGGWQITTSGHTTITGNHITLLTTPIRISSAPTGPLTISGNTFGSVTGMSTTGVLWISNGALVVTSNAISSATGAAYGLVVDGTATGIVATNRASAGGSGTYSIAAGPTQANNV